ncbi:MAG: histidine kinase [Chitinophagaceae bacterium]
MLKYLLLAAGCFSLLNIFGQEYSFRRYTPADGLSADDVHAIMQDSYGFLWIGTGNGLSRFDGKTFKNYGYTEGLRDLTIIKIYEDSHHRLWAGTPQGIAELKNGRFVHITPGNENFFVFSFSEAGGKGLKVFTDKGVYYYNDTSWTKTDFPSNYGSGKCLGIAAAPDGLYLNYEDGVYFKKNNGALDLLIKDTSEKNGFFCAQLSQMNGHIYAAIHSQFFELSAGKMRLLIDSLPVTHFFNFTVDAGNICWITIAGKGLYRYQLQPGQRQAVSFYKYDASTAGVPFTDNQQNLWITSYVGLIKVMPKIFEAVTETVQQGATKRPNVIATHNNEVIISDASGLHHVKNRQTFSLPKPVSYKDESSYQNDVVEGAAKDSRQFTWMITRSRKMLCWDGGHLLDFSHLLVPRNTDYIRNITVNPVNNKVFICDDSTLLCGNEKSFEVFTDRTGKQFSKTTTVLFTRNGIGMVNVYLKGIYFITRQNEIIKAPPELDMIEKGSYTYFFEDRDGWIWISNAGKGLVHFRISETDYTVKDLSILTTESGLPSNKIVDMAFDADGNKWVSCSNGLVVLKQHAPADNSWDVYPIGKEQNLQMVNPPTMAADNAGNVWLASMNGIVKVDTRKLMLKKITPVVVIEKVLLNMRETDWQQITDSSYGYLQLPVSPRLHYAQNTLGFEFSGVSIYNADYFEYSYQLQPLDKTWSMASSSNFIALARLSAGNYVFKVKTRGRGTAWSEPAIFNFSISPPFWDSWLFRILLIALAAAIVISLYFNRIRKIQRKAEIQNQLRELEMKALKAQMNPHFIYNALNSIQSLIADEKRTEAINYIGTFSRLLRHVLEYTENNVISLEKELQTLRLYIQLESLRLNINLVHSISTADDMICENEKLPPLILQPFVENALWHGLSRKEGEKKLHIAVSQNNGYLVCVIEDNGIGRASATAFKQQQLNDFSPRGIDITIKRLRGFNVTGGMPVVYHDLRDSEGNATGTRVVISIKRHVS